MDKIWFIIIDNKSTGPFSCVELRANSGITPDTLVWKEGFDGWKKIRDVPELKKLFEEDSKQNDEDENQIKLLDKDPPQDELVLEMGEMTQPPYFIWLLLALVSLLYVILHLYY